MFFYGLWNIVCFGGLLLAALTIARRQAWRAAVVAEGAIARNRDDARLSHADLENLRGQVPPSLLMEVVSELRHRYATNSPSGERLLDRLIAFLRAAMPAIRTGGSTLAAELETIRAYAALNAELAPHRCAWRITAPAKFADTPFPPLLLLPLLHAAARADAPVNLAVRQSGQVLVLEARGTAEIDSRGARDIERRLQQGLQGCVGATVAVSPSNNGLLISLPIATGAAPKLGRSAEAFSPLASRHPIWRSS
jgi:hypothetical protein